MKRVVLDTNVLVQAAIGSKAASGRVIDRYWAGDFETSFSPDTLTELLEALTLPQIRERHGWSDDEILAFVAALQANATLHRPTHSVPPSVTRDVTDAKFLALAEEINADYLVTNDRRHLLRLGQYHETRIVTPGQFLNEYA